MENESSFVDYARPIPKRDLPSPIAAMILSLPGLICWCVLLESVLLPRSWGASFRFLSRLFPPGSVLWCWLLAIVCALISVVCYWDRPKAWYVNINLAINVLGLLFTGAVGLLLMLSH